MFKPQSPLSFPRLCVGLPPAELTKRSMRICRDLYAGFMTPRRKLEVVEEKLNDLADMVGEVRDELFEEKLIA